MVYRATITQDVPGGLSSGHSLLPEPGIGLTTHVGGSLAQMKFPTGKRPQVGGGKRGAVYEFSRKARRNLLNYMNSLNTEKIKLPYFITLTYPKEYPRDKGSWTEHFNRRFRRRFERKYGQVPIIWRKEFQKRGAPHFHLLVFLDAPVGELREFVSRAWYESCGRICPEHLKAGTQVSAARTWRRVMGYASKYMGKVEVLSPGVESPGRFWGRWNDKALPIQPQQDTLPLVQAIKLRRVLRKYTGVRGPLVHRVPGNMSLYVSHRTTQSLLSWLGIIRCGREDHSFGAWRRRQDAAAGVVRR